MDKHGASTLVILRAFGIAMSIFVIVAMVVYWREVADSSFLEKNYLARDISQVITAATASPGEVLYCYDVSRYGYEYRIANAELSVSGGKGDAAAYWFAEGVKPVVFEKRQKPDIIEIAKSYEGVKVSGIGGNDDSPCR